MSRQRPPGFAASMVAVAALLIPAAGQAQSLLGTRGLGLPLDPVDARSRALGSFGLGLFGPSLLPTDPAAAADLRVPGITMAMQTSWVDVEGPADPTATATRFPLIGVAYPVGDLAIATLSFGSVFDQRWDARIEREIDLGDTEGRVVDTFVSDGGVSALRLGLARRVGPSLAVGASIGTHTGELTRRFTRAFDTLNLGGAIPPFTLGGAWNYSGATASLGAQVDVGGVVRAAGSVTWSGELTAEPTTETEGAGATFQLPTQYRFGASGVLAPGLQLVTSVSWSDWDETVSDDTEVPAARDVLGLGVGLEWENVSIIGASSPLRVGYRRTDLPFGFLGGEGAESVWTAGLGLNLAEVENIPLARVDLAVERGSRSGGGLTESFWRSSVTLRVANF